MKKSEGPLRKSLNEPWDKYFPKDFQNHLKRKIFIPYFLHYYSTSDYVQTFWHFALFSCEGFASPCL